MKKIRILYALLLCVMVTPSVSQELHDIIWTDINCGTQLDKNGDIYRSSNDCNYGDAASGNVFKGTNEDFGIIEYYGYIEFSIHQTDKIKYIGISEYNDGSHRSTIDYAIRLGSDKSVLIFKDGSYIGSYGNYNTGDVFRIQFDINEGRGDGRIWFKKNGSTFKYMETDGFPSQLIADVALYSINARFSDMKCTASALNMELNPSNSLNYIHTLTAKKAGHSLDFNSEIDMNEANAEIQYFDGLGRPMQSIKVGASPQGRDIVQPIVYDEFGRESQEYMPFVTDSRKGQCYTSPENPDNWSMHGNDKNYAYTRNYFDNSPLNRVIQETGPGKAWHKNSGDTDDKALRYEYSTNSTTDTDRKVIKWYIDGNTLKRVSATSYYEAGQLYLTITKNENWTSGKLNTTHEYKDKQGNVVLTRTWVTGENGTETVETYYVYDDFGLLRYVIPPKASQLLTSQSQLSPNDDIVKNLCYYYEYDHKHRMIMKQLPGAEQVYTVYDKRDRVILSQDGNQRENNECHYTIYDALNRPVETGIWSTGSDIRSFNDCSPGCYDPAQTNENNEKLTETYYDGYTDFSFSTYNLITENNGKAEETIKGLVAKTKTKILGTNQWLTTKNYYDKYGRVLLTVADNHLGGKDVVANQYNFAGEATKTVHKHWTSTQAAIYTTKTFEYDHTGRLLQVNQWINNDGTTPESEKIVLSAMEYNEIGELTTKKLYSDNNNNFTNFMQEVDFEYNIRGWNTKINDPHNMDSKDVFAMELQYTGNAAAQYNGNISRIFWKHSNTLSSFPALRYTFTYDELNRLKQASFFDEYAPYSGLPTNRYSVNNIDYDVNGNILNLARQGNLGSDGSYYQGVIDELDYQYYANSNKLKAVGDAASDLAGRGDFYDGDNGSTGQDYSYDANGNMTVDNNKEIIDINYNHLNLPKSVASQFNEQDYMIEFRYDAVGNKLSRELMSFDFGVFTKTDYVGNFIYENGVLKRILHDNGVINVLSNSNYEYQFFIKDHLGNTRVVCKPDFNSNGTLKDKPNELQRSDYYPFGMLHGGVDNQPLGVNENRYLYNGKEYQSRHWAEWTEEDDPSYFAALDWYDYGARFYDPQLGRWHSVDPLAESYYSYSPYNYALNDPIKFIDTDGTIVTDPDGNIVVTLGNKTETYEKLDNGEIAHYEYRTATIYANDGRPIRAKILVDSYIEGTGEPLPAYADGSSNCHGYSFANGKLWIDNDQVGELIEGDGYTSDGTTIENADVIILEVTEEWTYMGEEGERVDPFAHSAKVNEDGTYSDKGGTRGIQTNVSKKDIRREDDFTGTVKDGAATVTKTISNETYYRKTKKNTTIQTKAKANNGIVVENEDYVKKQF